jgi:hypothetical protein
MIIATMGSDNRALRGSFFHILSGSKVLGEIVSFNFFPMS